MTEVIIGIDPHKGSHTAVVLDRDERTLGRRRVKANASQLDQLRRWAAPWPQRTWAIEGARGLGRLLAQQLVAAGEQVVDVQPKLAARVRLLNSGQVNKNDPNDARSVAVAALRAPSSPSITAEDDTAAMKMWARRYPISVAYGPRPCVACTRCSAISCLAGSRAESRCGRRSS